MKIPAQSSHVVDGEQKAAPSWWTFFSFMGKLFASGYTGTVVLAKITGGGANGSLTVQSGIITAYTPPT